MARKHEVVKTRATPMDDIDDIDDVGGLVERILSRIEASHGVLRTATKHLSHIKRDVGEDIIEWLLPDKKRKGPLSGMPLVERRRFREASAILTEKRAEELSSRLRGFEITHGIMTPQYLHGAIRLAVEYTRDDITRAIDEYGASMSVLLLLTRAENEADRWKTLDRAKADGMMAVRSFAALMDEIAPEEMPRRPNAERAIRAAETRTRNRGKEDAVEAVEDAIDLAPEDELADTQVRPAPEPARQKAEPADRKAAAAERRRDAKAEKEALFRNFKSLAAQFRRMGAELEETWEPQLSDLWTAVADEMRKLDEKERVAALRELNPLMHHVGVIGKSCAEVTEAYKEYEKWESQQPRSAVKARKKK